MICKNYLFLILISFFLINTNATWSKPQKTSRVKLKRKSLNPRKNKKLNDNIKIRVLLQEDDSRKHSIFKIRSENTFIVSSPRARKKLSIRTKKLVLTIKDNNIYISAQNQRNKKITTKKITTKEIKINSTKNNIFTINDKTYQGNFNIKISEDNKLLIINNLNIDDYLYSVLVSESYQSWPLEMQKVQAIISRSYAVHYMLNSRKRNKKKPYDLKRSNFNQTYNGMHNYTHLRNAIKSTHNIILTHNNNVALTMFDACCGGAIPAKMSSIDFKKAPYLARTKACNFCKNYNLYEWERSISPSLLVKKLCLDNKIAKHFKGAGSLKNIHILDKDAAGIVNKIKIICSNNKFSISASDFWKNLRDKIKSLNFNIKMTKNLISFKGKGYGHQIGLCQRGARELVRKNWNYKKILSFYYPKTQFAKLKKYA